MHAVCVCVCEREREREREYVHTCVCHCSMLSTDVGSLMLTQKCIWLVSITTDVSAHIYYVLYL